jgi:hypothetical protein
VSLLATKVSPRRLTRCASSRWAFMVWLGLVTSTWPLAHPEPYLPRRACSPAKANRAAAVPPYISGRTSYLRVRLAFHPYPQVIPQFCNTGGFGPRRGLTRASPCPWIAHPVSGLIAATVRVVTSDRSPCSDSLSLRLHGFAVPLNLRAPPRKGGDAAAMNSPDHSTKGTPSPQ